MKTKPCPNVHLKPVRVLTALDWEIKHDPDGRATPGWCPQLSLSFYSVALRFFCGADGEQVLNHSSIRTPLKSTMELSRDSHSGKDIQPSGFHTKSGQQSCWSHTWRFFHSVPSILALSPGPLRVCSAPIRARRMQSPWVSFFLYAHLHATTKIAFPCSAFQVFWSCLNGGSSECQKRLMSNYCKEKEEVQGAY